MMSVGIWNRSCVRNPAHTRPGVTEPTGSKVKERAGLPCVVVPDPWNCLLVPVEQSLLALTLLCLFRYKPTGEVGAFYENPARLRAHGVQRCLHLPYVPRCCCCFLHPARPGCCMECALAWSKGLGMTLGQQGGATSCGWCVLEECCDPAG